MLFAWICMLFTSDISSFSSFSPSGCRSSNHQLEPSRPSLSSTFVFRSTHLFSRLGQSTPLPLSTSSSSSRIPETPTVTQSTSPPAPIQVNIPLPHHTHTPLSNHTSFQHHHARQKFTVYVERRLAPFLSIPTNELQNDSAGVNIKTESHSSFFFFLLFRFRWCVWGWGLVPVAG